LQTNKPTVTHAAAASTAQSTDRFGCAISLRQDVYWVGDFHGNAVNKHSLSTGALLGTISAGIGVAAMVSSVDRKFVLLATNAASNGPLKVLNAHTDAIVGTSEFDASDVSVCDDGTIVGAYNQIGARLATYSIDDAGALTTLDSVATSIAIQNTVCSPGSLFVVAVVNSGLNSYALSSLTTVPVDSISPTGFAMSLAFNEATSDLYLLMDTGELLLYTFDSSTGSFGAQQASADFGMAVSPVFGVEQMQFAYGKVFVETSTQLLVYDAALNLISSETIVTDERIAVCVSVGMKCLVVNIIVVVVVLFALGSHFLT
jgi:hypothetical protein